MSNTVLFDLDGVLVDSYPVWFRVLNATLAEHGKPTLTEEEFRPSWGQSVQADRERWFPELSREDLEAAFERHFMTHVAAVRVMDGAREAVDALRARGVRLGLVTNSQHGIAMALLAAAGLDGRFDVVVTGSDVPNPKPAPDMLLLAAERLGATPGAAVLVGDSEYDRGAAEAAGCAFVHFGRDVQSLAELDGHIEAPVRSYRTAAGRFPAPVWLYVAGTFFSGQGLVTVWMLRNIFLSAVGYDETFLGWTLAATFLGSVVTAATLGLWMDRLRIKPFLVGGMIALALGLGGTARFSEDGPLLMLSCFLSGLGHSVIFVTMGPFFMRHAPAAIRPYVFTTGTAMLTLASAAGGAMIYALGTTWEDTLEGHARIHDVAAGAAIVAALIFAMIREAPPPPRRRMFELAWKTVGKLCLPEFVLGLGAALTIPFMNLYFHQRHGLKGSDVAALLGCSQILLLGGFVMAPAAARRFGAVNTIVAFKLLSLPFLLVLAVTTHLAVAFGAFLFRHMLANMMFPVLSQFEMEVVPANQRSATNGLFMVSWQAAWFIATACGGWLVEHTRLLIDGFSTTMIVSAALYLGSAALFYGFFHSKTSRRSEETTTSTAPESPVA